MNEQLTELLKKAIEVAEKTGDFAIEQAPLLLQEFYDWQIISIILSILLCLFLIFLPYWSRLLISKKEETDYYDKKILGRWFEIDNVPFIIWVVPSAASVFIGILFLLENIYKLIFILTAPKIYLIEYFIK